MEKGGAFGSTPPTFLEVGLGLFMRLNMCELAIFATEVPLKLEVYQHVNSAPLGQSLRRATAAACSKINHKI